MDILITGTIAKRGTGELIGHFKDRLLKRYPEGFINKAEALSRTSCDTETQIQTALSHGAVYVKEYTEFGILEALYGMSKELKCGMEVRIRDIPIRQETVEVCEELGVNPYALCSGDSLLIVCKDGAGMQEILRDQGVEVTLVGVTCPGNDKMLLNGEERGYLPHIREDELTRILREVQK